MQSKHVHGLESSYIDNRCRYLGGKRPIPDVEVGDLTGKGFLVMAADLGSIPTKQSQFRKMAGKFLAVHFENEGFKNRRSF
jgi:hypothetical protein